jgi:hypothetical protein
MKITKDMVGKKVRLGYWDKREFLEILAIGETKIFTRDQNGVESMWCIDSYWEFYSDPKTKHRAAPALVKYRKNGGGFISDQVFETEEEAKKSCGEWLIKWPASETSWVEWEE